MGAYRALGTKDSDGLLQQAIDASDMIGRWEYDVQNDRIYADALVALVFNLDPAETDAGASLNAFLSGVHPEDRERFASEVKRSTQTGHCCTFEYRVRSADGRVRWILDRGRIALDGSGRPQRGFGILVDITQSRLGRPAENLEPDREGQHPIERAVDHCLAARKAIHELPEPLLHRMSDMLLLEVGRTLSKLTDALRSMG